MIDISFNVLLEEKLIFSRPEYDETINRFRAYYCTTPIPFEVSVRDTSQYEEFKSLK